MKAARCRRYGPPAQVVTVEDVDDPSAGPGQVVVDVRAASVNFTDVLLCHNAYQVKAEVPFTPGSEFAGVVTEVGPEVTSLAPGDRVAGAALVGAFAERIAVSADGLRPVPDTLGWREAAAAGVVTQTAYHALRSVAEVSPGEWVVVLGAAGGVGLSAVDLAQVLGARVVAAASSAEKLDLCRRRGAEVTIDYATEDLKARIKEATGGGAHVVIDPVGGPHAEAALRALRWGGRYVTLGYASGAIPSFPLNLILLKGVRVEGMEFLSFTTHASAKAERDRHELTGLLAAGRAIPYISAAVALPDVADALTAVEQRRALGKIVVETGAPSGPAYSAPDH